MFRNREGAKSNIESVAFNLIFHLVNGKFLVGFDSGLFLGQEWMESTGVFLLFSPSFSSITVRGREEESQLSSI